MSGFSIKKYQNTHNACFNNHYNCGWRARISIRYLEFHSLYVKNKSPPHMWPIMNIFRPLENNRKITLFRYYFKWPSGTSAIFIFDHKYYLVEWTCKNNSPLSIEIGTYCTIVNSHSLVQIQIHFLLFHSQYPRFFYHSFIRSEPN